MPHVRGVPEWLHFGNRWRSQVMTSHLRIAIIGLMAIQLFSSFGGGPRTAAAQDASTTYTDPHGAFTMQWDAPWAIVRQDDTVTMISDGTLVMIPAGSVLIGTMNLDSCLPALANAAGDPTETSYPVLGQGRTTWRAWIAYQNDSVGLGDYFECQIAPNGRAFALLVGGLSLGNVDADLARLVEFAGHTIVQPSGEAGPALAGGGVRAGVVAWNRETVDDQLGLKVQQDKDWVVAVADLTNTQTTDAAIPLKSFAVRDVESTTRSHASARYSAAVAAKLGEGPAADVDTISLPAGLSQRVVLVFSITHDAGQLAFSLDDRELELPRNTTPVRFGILTPPALPVTFEHATVKKAVDGRTLSVTLDDGTGATVQLIGLDVPVKDECDAAKAKKALAKLAGTAVLLESDPAVADGKRLNRHVWTDDGSRLLADALIEAGDGVISNQGSRFGAMLVASEERARTANAGVWRDCGSKAAKPASSPEAITDADRAYLTGLQKPLALLDISLPLIGGAVADGEVSNDFVVAILSANFVIVGVAEHEIGSTPAPARYKALQTAYLAALKPLTDAIRSFSELDAAVDEYLSNGGHASLQLNQPIDIDALSTAYATTMDLLGPAKAQLDTAMTEAGS
jgi:endonuclease YncB( thermonuclease family)